MNDSAHSRGAKQAPGPTTRMHQKKRTGLWKPDASSGPTAFEFAVFALLCAMVGVAWFEAARPSGLPLLQHWLREDGVVEWLTVAGLVALAGLCVHRCVVLWRDRPPAFLVVTALAGAAFIFGAGEEISWGQRLLGLEPPAWFAEHNRQSEINVHNLVLGSRDLNKWLFGQVLTVGLVAFMGLSLVHRLSPGFRTFAARLGLPVARGRHVAALALFALLLHGPAVPGRSSELFELVAVLTVLMVFVNPANRAAFTRSAAPPD